MGSSKPSTYGELIEVLDALPLLVREKRRRDGLSLRGAAKQVGLSFSTLARFEEGETVQADNVRALLVWVGDSRG